MPLSFSFKWKRGHDNDEKLVEEDAVAETTPPPLRWAKLVLIAVVVLVALLRCSSSLISKWKLTLRGSLVELLPLPLVIPVPTLLDELVIAQ